MTFDVARCLAEKDIHRLKSVWQALPLCNRLLFCLCQSPVSSSLGWPLSTQCLQSADVRPGCFSPGPATTSQIWTNQEIPNEEMSEATGDFEVMYYV